AYYTLVLDDPLPSCRGRVDVLTFELAADQVGIVDQVEDAALETQARRALLHVQGSEVIHGELPVRRIVRTSVRIALWNVTGAGRGGKPPRERTPLSYPPAARPVACTARPCPVALIPGPAYYGSR